MDVRDESDDRPNEQQQVGEGHLPERDFRQAAGQGETDTHGSPEPPAGWSENERANYPENPEPHEILSTANFSSNSEHAKAQDASASYSSELRRARNFIVGSQVGAVISVFLGGIALSTISMIIAIIGYRKITALARDCNMKPDVAQRLKRSAILAIGVCAVALAFNVVTIVVFYPVLMEALQQGNVSGLFGGGGGVSNQPASPSSTSLFG